MLLDFVICEGCWIKKKRKEEARKKKKKKQHAEVCFS